MCADTWDGGGEKGALRGSRDPGGSGGALSQIALLMVGDEWAAHYWRQAGVASEWTGGFQTPEVGPAAIWGLGLVIREYSNYLALFRTKLSTIRLGPNVRSIYG